MTDWRLRGAEVLPTFEPALAAIEREVLDTAPNVTFVLTPDLTIGYVNAAWWSFAAANGADWSERAWGPGDPLLEVVPPALNVLIRGVCRRLLRDGGSWDFDYECSTPERYRLFRMTIAALHDSVGLLTTHAARIERELGETHEGLLRRAYRGPHGIIRSCSYCTCTMRAEEPHTWDWVPSVHRLTDLSLSHGICDTCFVLHHGTQRGDGGDV